MLQFPVGPYTYDLALVDEPIFHHGRPCMALTLPDERRIKISAHVRPELRVALAWHEIAHAWRAELDIHEAESLGHEAYANLVALAMAQYDGKTIARLQLYLTRGIVADDVIIISGVSDPIPVFHDHLR